MTFPAIAAISGISGISGLTGMASAASATTPTAATGAAATSGTDFAGMLSHGLNSLQASQSTADGLAVKAATGDLSDIAQYTIAATQASLATSLATTLTSKGVEAFNQIMGMQA